MTRAALLFLLLCACSAPNDARKVLADAGYTDVNLHGYSWFCCSDDDTFATSFDALSPAGVRVNGCVCGGWMKGQTIRIK